MSVVAVQQGLSSSILRKIDKTQEFGELKIGFVDEYETIWTDKGSGGKYDGSYYRPKPPKGYFHFGCSGEDSHSDLDNKRGTMVVKPSKSANNDKPPLKAAADYVRIWKDKGSGADKDVSFWQPVPPKGYVAMGVVAMKGHSTAPHSDHEVVCVRIDLTRRGDIGAQVWTDKSTGSDNDFGSWDIIVRNEFINQDRILMASGSFVASNSHSQPDFDKEVKGTSKSGGDKEVRPYDVVNVLDLPVPIIKENAAPSSPSLTSANEPNGTTLPVVERVVVVPYTAINDDARSTSWKVSNSPFYPISRESYYTLIMYNENKSSVQQELSNSITTGVSNSESQSFSVETGVSVTVTEGVSAGFNIEVLSAKSTTTVGVTMSLSLGYSSSTSVTEFQSETIVRDLVTPAESAGALWVKSSSMQVYRADGTSIGAPMLIDADSVVEDSFPL